MKVPLMETKVADTGKLGDSQPAHYTNVRFESTRSFHNGAFIVRVFGNHGKQHWMALAFVTRLSLSLRL